MKNKEKKYLHPAMIVGIISLSILIIISLIAANHSSSLVSSGVVKQPNQPKCYTTTECKDVKVPGIKTECKDVPFGYNIKQSECSYDTHWFSNDRMITRYTLTNTESRNSGTFRIWVGFMMPGATEPVGKECDLYLQPQTSGTCEFILDSSSSLACTYKIENIPTDRVCTDVPIVTTETQCNPITKCD